MAILVLCLAFLCQLCNLIAVGGDVCIDAPLKILCPEHDSVQVDFHTMVAHVTYVVIEIGVTIRGGIGDAAHQAARVVVVVFNRTGQTVLEEGKVGTHIELGIGFP